jgi:hypothetical protein
MPPASGRVLQVNRSGQPGSYATLAQVAAASVDGDTIEIAGGTYRGAEAFAVFTRNNLRLIGKPAADGTPVTLDAAGQTIGNGKAIWVVQGTNVTIENIAFVNAKVRDRNGAGIRQEGTNLWVRNARFANNENGILGSPNPLSTVRIENSVFADNGYGDGYSHNIYVNQIHRLEVTGSVFQGAKVGHQLKSRARQSSVSYSTFADLEAGTASYELDFPNGGDVTLVGNVVQKGPAAQNNANITVGVEGNCWPTNRLTMTHNSVANDMATGRMVWVDGAVSPIIANANVWIGRAPWLSGYAESSVQQSANLRLDYAGFAAGAIGRADLRLSSTQATATLAPNPQVTHEVAYGADGRPTAATRPLDAQGLRMSGALQSRP